MMQEFNAGFRFLENAASHSDCIALKSDEVDVSYGQLRNFVVCFALHLQEHSINHRSTICIRSDDPMVVIASIFATALIGCRWTYVSQAVLALPETEITHFLQEYKSSVSAPDDTIWIDEKWARPPSSMNSTLSVNFSGFESPEAPWILTHTSGTTGTPKFMELSFKNAFGRATAPDDDFVPFQTIFASLFPISAFPYINRVLTALLNNCTVVQSSNPEFWIESGVTLVMGSPNQVLSVFSDNPISTKIGTLHVGGAALSKDLASKLLESFGEVVDLYGSRETNRTYKHIRKIGSDGSIVSTGQLLDAEIEIVNADDIPVADGEEGIVRIRNEHLVKGYFNSPAAEVAAFRGGWFYPGDLGRWGETGILEITGRSNDLINIGGVKVNAVAIDAAVMSVHGIADAICFLLPTKSGVGELAVFMSLSADANKEKCEMLARISCGDGESAFSPKKFFYNDHLPRNDGGKPDRNACVILALGESGL